MGVRQQGKEKLSGDGGEARGVSESEGATRGCLSCSLVVAVEVHMWSAEAAGGVGFFSSKKTDLQDNCLRLSRWTTEKQTMQQYSICGQEAYQCNLRLERSKFGFGMVRCK
jgi:hypothetical protein